MSGEMLRRSGRQMHSLGLKLLREMGREAETRRGRKTDSKGLAA